MKILMCSSEVAPFSKTGGLADVLKALPPYLLRRGHDVRIVTPLHGCINRSKYDLRLIVPSLGVPVGFGEQWCAVYETDLPGSDVPVYLIEHQQYFGREQLYQYDGEDYRDNAERFAFFSRACMQLCKALQFSPDVMHCHDWQTGLIPVYLKSWDAEDPLLRRTASVFTIHNVGYQGVFGKDDIVHCQLGWERFTLDGLEYYNKINYMKAGILYADKVSTVSPRYAQEIQTPEGGWTMDGALRSRSPDLVGILNGCDYDEWNPMRDNYLPEPFDVDNMAGRTAARLKLQQTFDLAQRDNVPIVAIVSRLAYQKGIDVLAAAIPGLMAMDLQFVVLGTGETWAHFEFGKLPIDHPLRAGAYIGFDNSRAHLVTAGSDFLLIPSRYEPCGLTQYSAMRYGTLPIVRATGGLDDTVDQYNEQAGSGTGFKFHDLTASAIVNTVGWAVSTYYDRPQHLKAMRREAMEKRFSWAESAKRYEDLFRWSLERKGALHTMYTPPERPRTPSASPSTTMDSTAPLSTMPEDRGNISKATSGDTESRS